MENKKYALYTFLTLMIELSIASVMYLLVVKLQTSLSFYFRCSVALRNIKGDMRNGGFIPLFYN